MSKVEKIKDLSLADLKAAHDFVKEDIEDCYKKANEERVPVQEIGCYKELTDMENILYHELLNRTRNLQK